VPGAIEQSWSLQVSCVLTCHARVSILWGDPVGWGRDGGRFLRGSAPSDGSTAIGRVLRRVWRRARGASGRRSSCGLRCDRPDAGLSRPDYGHDALFEMHFVQEPFGPGSQHF
jgi:hypothetical protein